MSPFEIALIVIGIVCIIISCFVIEQKKETVVETEIGSITEQLLYSQISEANEKISSQMSQLKDDIYENSKEEMNQLSNEKILAVHEYSEQVLADIRKGHEEVMFLYQMLTEKEEELKTSLQEMQQTKRELEKLCSITDEVTPEIGQKVKTLVPPKKEKNAKKAAANTSNGKKQGHPSQQVESKLEEKNLQENPEMGQESHYTKTLQEIESQEFSSHIDEILTLSDQGYSVIEISKRLSLGQGEVKLVLDYNKKK